MRPRKVLSTDDISQLLAEAVHDRALAVVTVHTGSDWVTFKSRFLERDETRHFFVLDHVPHEQPLPQLAVGQYVGISFRQRSRKVLFSTIVEARGQFVVDPNTNIAAIRYRWPDTLTELQRRVYMRTPVPADVSLPAQVWTGGRESRTGAPVTGELDNLSCGGAFIRMPTVPADWADGQHMSVEVDLGDGREPLRADARYRGSRSDPVGVSGVAVQFIGLEMTADGRLGLQRIARCVQKLHARGMSPRGQTRTWSAQSDE